MARAFRGVEGGTKNASFREGIIARIDEDEDEDAVVDKEVFVKFAKPADGEFEFKFPSPLTKLPEVKTPVPFTVVEPGEVSAQRDNDVRRECERD